MPPRQTYRVVLIAAAIGAAALATVTGTTSASGDEVADPPESIEAVNEPAGGGATVPGGTPTAGPVEASASVDNETDFIAALTNLGGIGGGPHTINITGSFTISGAADPTYSNLATEALIINGNGFTIRGNDNSRVLYNNSSQPLTIHDLTVLDGDSDGDGGAVFSEGDLTLTDCTFEDNYSDDDGGAVAVDPGSLTVTRCAFGGNAADDEAGALRKKSAGTATVTDSTFTDNEAYGGGGGAIEINGPASLTVTGSTFTDNTADEEGGAIETADGLLTVRTSTFTANESTGSDGGAIDAASGAEITDSTFDRNRAESDGGAVDTSDEDTDLIIDGSTFVENQNADGDGGAVEAERDLVATNSTFTGNEGTEDVANAEEGDVTFRHVTFVDNVTEQNDPDDGGIDSDGDGTTFTSFAGAYGGNTPNTCEIGDFATIVSEGYNHADDDSCGLNSGPGDVENGPDPQVVPLADFGGPTRTRPPSLPGSPLIDAIPVADCSPTIVVDQRDLPRPSDGDLDGVDGCDIGAVEVQAQIDEPPPDTAPIDATPPFTG